METENTLFSNIESSKRANPSTRLWTEDFEGLTNVTHYNDTYGNVIHQDEFGHFGSGFHFFFSGNRSQEDVMKEMIDIE